jgi:hypothetical protein
MQNPIFSQWSIRSLVIARPAHVPLCDTEFVRVMRPVWNKGLAFAHKQTAMATTGLRECCEASTVSVNDISMWMMQVQETHVLSIKTVRHGYPEQDM